MSSKLKITSEVQAISEVQVIPYGDGKEFKKRTLVIADKDNDYNDSIVFELGGKKLDLTDPYKVGDLITVYGEISCRENKNKPGNYFTSLKAWKIESAGSQPPKTDTSNEPPPESDIPF